MQLKTNITTERIIDIKLPVFWKEPPQEWAKGRSEYLAILDEKTCVSFYISDNYTTITHCLPETRDIAVMKAHLTWDKVTEEEFLAAHKEALKSLSLEPIFFDYANDLKDVL